MVPGITKNTSGFHGKRQQFEVDLPCVLKVRDILEVYELSFARKTTNIAYQRYVVDKIKIS